MGKPNLLVLCTGNSARSQIAEAFFRKHGSDLFNAYSAGTDPKGINPLTVEVMAERGIDMSCHRSKNLTEYLGHLPVHTLIIVCGGADKKCPVVWPGIFERLFWPFDDPAAAEGARSERLDEFRRVRDQIEEKIVAWLKLKREK
ncbi:MAG TPA: arsenate reductase ArsC [Planctomycetota bacterium]|nr:arsenate reductase ArsC [Planctomycetota bacterium]